MTDWKVFAGCNFHGHFCIMESLFYNGRAEPYHVEKPVYGIANSDGYKQSAKLMLPVSGQKFAGKFAYVLAALPNYWHLTSDEILKWVWKAEEEVNEPCLEAPRS